MNKKMSLIVAINIYSKRINYQTYDVTSLLNNGKSEGLSAFTGSRDLGLFQNIKARGPEKAISVITLILGIAFMALVIVIKITE